MDTPVNVKLLLPPRQSRGNSHYISQSFCDSGLGFQSGMWLQRRVADWAELGRAQ